MYLQNIGMGTVIDYKSRCKTIINNRLHFKTILFLALLLMPQLLLAQVKFVVKTQTEFEQLNSLINETLKRGEAKIEVIIRPGTYYYKENHILLTGYNRPLSSLSIKAKRARIISYGKTYSNGDAFDGRFDENNAFITDNLTLLPIWSPVRWTEGLMEVVDENTKLCRIKCPGIKDTEEQECQYARIRIPHWFLMSSWSIKKIESGYIYFVAKDLQKLIGNGWYVNDDYYYGQLPNLRYSLSNIEAGDHFFSIVRGRVHLPKGVRNAHECTSKHFLTLKDCHLNKISIDGLRIIGSSWYMTYLMSFDNVINNSLRIDNCDFSCITGDVVSFKETSNATVSRCSFKDCYRNCVVSDIGSINTVIKKCEFIRTGLAFENTSAVRCQGEDYHIVDNLFEDFGYSAISLGYGKTRSETQKVSGVTEYNTILYTEDYIEMYKDIMLMDGGAIYFRTQNDKAIIRYNYISGYDGMKDNRGIFCDAGAYNIEIYGNIITHIANSYCIDSRRVVSVEKDGSRGINVNKTNINNKIYDNIVDGKIRFAAREGGDNNCELGANYFLLNKSEDMPRNEYFNLDTEGKEVKVVLKKNRGTKYYVSKSSYQTLKNSPSWSFFRLFIKQ